MNDELGMLGGLGEEELLARILPVLGSASQPRAHPAAGPSAGSRSGAPRSVVAVGPGDDAAVLEVGAGGGPGTCRLVATTDAVVRGRDWRDEWSTGADVGAKVAAQNLADVAAMGARPAGLLVTLVADPATPVAWVVDLAHGLASVAAQARCPVLGGDLSSAPSGTLVVSVTALGLLGAYPEVLRSGAREGDVVALAGSLGLAAAGWRLLEEGRSDADPEAVARQRRPQPPLRLGPAAAEAGATAMIDISDGLLRDAARLATASGVCVDLADAALAADVARLVPALGPEHARRCVLAGGEEHSLLATFPPGVDPPGGFREVGRVRRGSGVAVDGVPHTPEGWDHFGR